MNTNAPTGIPQSEDSKRKKRILNDVKKELKRVRSYTPKVGIFGDTGVGKSSLCNALFGKDIAKISNVEACTREPQEILIGGDNGSGIILVDVPGVGEDPDRHQEYVELYKSLSGELDLIIWAIKADDRKYMSAIEVYKDILEPNINICPVVFVITQVDKIEPYREWDTKKNIPSKAQEANLQLKINDISDRFDISTNKIVAVSASDSYNLVELVNRIVKILPNEKKFSFTRETKDENVSEEACMYAEKGIFDHIKEMAGETWDFIKDDALDLFIDVVKRQTPKIAKKVIKWFSSWF